VGEILKMWRLFFIPLMCGFLFLPGDALAKEMPVDLWPRPSSHFGYSYPSDEQIQKEMKKYVGVRYRLGGSTRRGMDCSGFVRRMYANLFGVDLPHKASVQYSLPIFKKIPRKSLKTGDLIFFSFQKRKKRINHVGIYLSNGLFMHAARSKGVIISRLNKWYWKSKIVGTRRLIDRELWTAMEAFQSIGEVGFSPGGKTAFQMRYSSTEYRPFHYRLESRHLADLRVDKFQAFELEYTRELLDDLWSLQVTAFREALHAGAMDAHYPHPLHSGIYSSDGNFDSIYRQGIRLASNITPIQWLHITPSLTYLDYGQGIDESDLPRRSLGLEISLGSLAGGWSFSTAFQYCDQGYLMSSILDPSNGWNALDMSLTFRHQLTDYMQFSLIGQHVLQDTTSLESNVQHMERHADHSFFFTLDFSY